LQLMGGGAQVLHLLFFVGFAHVSALCSPLYHRECSGKFSWLFRFVCSPFLYMSFS
jgi:hypothetical protein